MTFTSPLRSYDHVSAGFGTYTYTIGGVTTTALHGGVDYAASSGTSIYSISDGKVVYATKSSEHPTLGNFVLVQHANESGALIDRFSLYAHMKSVPLVESGNWVTQNSNQLGSVGSTGVSEGNHLHMSVLRGISTSEILAITDASLGFYESSKAIQTGSFEAENLYGDISRTVNNGIEVRNDYFISMGGDDTIYGGSGVDVDTVEYQETIENIWFYRFDASTSFAFAYQSDGEVKADILYNIERLADNGANNVIDMTDAAMQTLFVGSSSSATRYVVPTLDYQNVDIDGGGGQDTVVVWGVRSDWQVIDVSGPSYWLTSNSTPPTAGPNGAISNSANPSSYTIKIKDVERVEFADGTDYAVTDLLDGISGQDLTVASVGLGSTAASPGSDISVSFDIANIGNQATSSTQGQIILSSSSDFSGTIHVLDTFSIAELDASGGAFSSKHFAKTVTLPTTLGRTDYYVGVRADTTNSITEASETNNLGVSLALSVGGGLSGDPDLRISSFPSFPDGVVSSSGAVLPLSFNIGANSYGSVPYTYRILFSTDDRLSADDTVLHEETTARGLGYLGVHYYTQNVNVPVSAPDGIGYFFLQIDPDNAIAERREDNNVRTQAIVISSDTADADLLPDLFAQRVHIRDADTRETVSTIYAGQTFNYATEFGNLSPDDAVPDVRQADNVTVFENALILSKDAIVSADDRVLHLNNWNAFEPGEFRKANSSVTMTLPSDIDSGIYYVAVVVDYFNVVQEEIESNNVSFVQQIEIINNIPVSISTVDDTLSLVDVSMADGNVLTNDLYQLFSTPVIDRLNDDGSLIGTAHTLSSGATFQLNADGSYALDAENILGSMSVGSSVTESVTYRATGVNGDVSSATIEITLTRSDPDSGTSGNDLVNGTQWGDFMHGRSGHDTVFGFKGDDTIYGDDGNDKLYGGAGSDRIYGGAGDDYVRVGGGVESFYGGSGSDDYISYYDSTGGIEINLATNVISGSWAVNDKISGFESVSGSSIGSDTVYGTNGANRLKGYGGDDKFYAGSGNDKVYGGAGDDYVRVGGGVESFYGGSGSDDYISYYDSTGGIEINLATNVISGSWAVNDKISGFESVSGSSIGSDTVYGTNGANRLKGYGGDDKFYAGSGNDKVYGGAGDDYVRVGGGVESFYGGSGTNDYISYYDSSNGVNVNLATNVVSGSWASNDVVKGFESISGSKTGGDTITGTDGANTIKTYGGDDSVYAGSGSDKVYLGDGDDYVRVGGGLESFYGGDGKDYISYYDSAGGVNIDLESNIVSGSWAVNDVISGFESAAGSGAGNDKMYGTSGANRLKSYGGNDSLYGRTGEDKLYGGSGNDRFDGGHGDDSLYGGSGADTFHFDHGEDKDVIKDFENNVDTIQLDNFGYADVTEALTYATETGGDVVFDFGGGDMLTIENATKAQLVNDLEIV